MSTFTTTGLMTHVAISTSMLRLRLQHWRSEAPLKRLLSCSDVMGVDGVSPSSPPPERLQGPDTDLIDPELWVFI